MDNHIYYHHFQDNNKKFTIAGKFALDSTGEPELVLGIALCSQKDNLCRKIGRTIATGRINGSRTTRGSSRVLLYCTDAVTKDLGITVKMFEEAFPDTHGPVGFKENWFAEDPARVFHGICVWLSSKGVNDLKSYFRLQQH